MRAFQCSKCKQLEENDIDDKVFCGFGLDLIHRDKADAIICKTCFEEIEKDKQWHEPFRWEGGEQK
jgi:hypothetical protein